MKGLLLSTGNVGESHFYVKPVGNRNRFTGTLDAYIDKYTSLVPFLNPSVTTTPPSDAAPEDLTSKAITLRVRRLGALYCLVYFNSRELRSD